MKIEPNMYVRTKYGIFKIRKITKDLAYGKHENRVIELDRNIPEYNYRFSFYKDESIFKSAKFKDKITELIQVGDYVNGERVDSVGNKCVIFYDGDGDIEIFEDKIKSIVTKEQFESMSYKLGDNK